MGHVSPLFTVHQWEVASSSFLLCVRAFSKLFASPLSSFRFPSCFLCFLMLPRLHTPLSFFLFFSFSPEPVRVDASFWMSLIRWLGWRPFLRLPTPMRYVLTLSLPLGLCQFGRGTTHSNATPFNNKKDRKCVCVCVLFFFFFSCL